MRIRPLLLVLVCFAVLHAHADAQQPAQLLRSSLAAQSGQATVQDVTLSGTVQSISGADDETVPGLFKAISAGSARSDVSLSAGTLTEIRQVAVTGASGVWSSGNSSSHAMAGQNVMTDAAWFFPLFVVKRLLSDPKAIVTVVGTQNGVIHLQAVEQQPASLSSTAASQIQHLTQMDLYLDAKSLLPVGLGFNIHPDNNALVDIPVYVQFSNYQQTSSVTVPMRVQKYINNTLQMDIQMQSVAVNTGLTSTEFAN
jgi:hypothetical protein